MALKIGVVWFKRDLRTVDHEAMVEALKVGPVLPIYILEPKLWQQADMSERHFAFLSESVHELSAQLQKNGVKLVIRVGDVVEVLEDIASRHTIQLWSHQETWNDWTYQRDIRVKKWCQERGIVWHELPQHGVVRCLRDRDGWAAKWYAQMKRPLFSEPIAWNAIDDQSDQWPSRDELGLPKDVYTRIQGGGRSRGLRLLHSFLHERGEGYSKEMSSPLTAFTSCSRLSTHIAFGTVSVREVFQASEARSLAIKRLKSAERGKWLGALRSFSGRLRWHCHFIQKLEDQPRIEFDNLHPAYDGLREGAFNQQYFEAWKAGMTGYPMVDACMRALRATGWLNFRMRAMIVSFASYHLWLHWREVALYLAKLFTDYEPGIHYSQIQMQSGTTGINAIRIYNPIKQSMDQDPEGVFIRRWIPELSEMGDDFIHTPWLCPAKMGEYPMPIVDEKIARKHAADKIYGLRKNNQQHREVAREIVQKHGSRKSNRTTRKAPKRSPQDKQQGEFPL